MNWMNRSRRNHQRGEQADWEVVENGPQQRNLALTEFHSSCILAWPDKSAAGKNALQVLTIARVRRDEAQCGIIQSC